MNSIWALAKTQSTRAALDDGDSVVGAGRVLRIKDGYNPNSSSIGSTVPTYLAAAAAAGALTVVLLQAQSVVARLLRKRAAASPQPIEQAPPDRSSEHGEASPEDQ